MEDSPLWQVVPAWLVVLVLLLLLVFVALQIWLTARWDRQRIRKYIASRGGEVLSIKYRQFGKGWRAHDNTRAYAIQYVNSERIPHRVICRTAWLGGVFFTDDEAVNLPEYRRTARNHPKPGAAALDEERIRQLEEENAALRAELERLRSSQGQKPTSGGL